MNNEVKKEANRPEKPRLAECELSDQDLAAVVGGLFKPGASISGTLICLRRGRVTIR